ncbi:MAG: protein kinase family protein [Oligoflexales bacterium]|nr:protein kinase family protein [Oligoflexales bacterium]
MDLHISKPIFYKTALCLNLTFTLSCNTTKRKSPSKPLGEKHLLNASSPAVPNSLMNKAKQLYIVGSPTKTLELVKGFTKVVIVGPAKVGSPHLDSKELFVDPKEVPKPESEPQRMAESAEMIDRPFAETTDASSSVRRESPIPQERGTATPAPSPELIRIEVGKTNRVVVELPAVAIPQLKNISFPPEEDAAFVFVPADHLIVKATQQGSVLVGTIEYRNPKQARIGTTDGVLLEALNLVPRIDEISVHKKLFTKEGDKQVIASTNFRNDPQFDLKTRIVHELASLDKEPIDIAPSELPSRSSVRFSEPFQKIAQGDFSGSTLFKTAFDVEGSRVELVVKKIPLTDTSGQYTAEKMMQRAATEVSIGIEMSRHPNSIPVYGAYIANDSCYIVMEPMQGSLKGMMFDHSPEGIHSLYIQLTLIVRALSALHRGGFAHNDSSLRNFFYKGRLAFLGDYGEAERTKDTFMFTIDFAKFASEGLPPWLSANYAAKIDELTREHRAPIDGEMEALLLRTYDSHLKTKL